MFTSAVQYEKCVLLQTIEQLFIQIHKSFCTLYIKLFCFHAACYIYNRIPPFPACVMLCVSYSLVQNKIEVKSSKARGCLHLPPVLVRSSTYSAENNQRGTKHHGKPEASAPAQRHYSTRRRPQTGLSTNTIPWVKKEKEKVIFCAKSLSVLHRCCQQKR